MRKKSCSLSKRRGFIFQSGEIYGGINGFWDYGPLGAELKRNVKELWWKSMTRFREDVVGLDATIIMHPAIWKASGHVATFVDMMRECPFTRKRVRTDQVEPQSGNAISYTGAHADTTGLKIEKTVTILLKKGSHIESIRKTARQFYALGTTTVVEEIILDGETNAPVEDSIDFHPESGVLLGESRPFNLMLKTYIGPTATEGDVAYLRPETAQAIFAQFKNVVDSSRGRKFPSVSRKSARHSVQREGDAEEFHFPPSREFEQMELEFFHQARRSGGDDQRPGDPGSGWTSWRSTARMGLADLAQILGGRACAFLREHRPGPRHAGGILAKAG